MSLLLTGLVASVGAVIAFAPPPSSSAQIASPAASTLLAAGSVVEREMVADEVHPYAIELQAGQYVQLVVEQRGADVVQELKAPDGVVLLATDCPCGYLGPDLLAFVAASPGVYALSLRAQGVPNPPGRYSLRVEAVREPDDADRIRAKAVKALSDGFGAVHKDPRTALEPFQAAASLWEAAGDRRMRMWSEQMVGFVQAGTFDRHAEAAATVRHALATALELGDEWAQARLRYALAISQRTLGEFEEARANYERSIALHRAAGRVEDGALAMSALGNLHSLAAEPQIALDYLEEALGSFRAAGNARSEAATLNIIGYVYLRVGDPELALERFRAVERLIERPTDYRGRMMGGTSSVRARALTGTALAHQLLGDFEAARAAYRAALDLYETMSSRIAEADALLGLGDLYREQGDDTKARETYESALALHRSRASLLGEAQAQCRLGEIHRRARDAKAARAAFQAALDAGPRAGALLRVCAESGLARLGRDTGDLDPALDFARSALRTAESSRSRMASPATRAAALALDQSLYDVTIDILMRQHEARPAAGADRAAFDVSEQARARTLLDVLAQGRVDVRRGVAPDLLEEERSLRRRLNATAAAQDEARVAGRTERVEALDRELGSLSAQLDEAQSRIRRASPEYAALTQPQPLTLDQVRGVLDADTQLLQYALGEERSYLWVASRGALASFHLPPRVDIEAAARRLRDLTQLPAESSAAREARRELGRLILAPAAGALTARRLLVVAPGALEYVPFATLPLPDETPLIARFELVSAPSASVVATLRGEPPPAPPVGQVAVLADPVFEGTDPRLAVRARTPSTGTSPAGLGSDDKVQSLKGALRGTRSSGGLSRLPFSRREAEGIVALAPRRQAFAATGFEASKEAAIGPRVAGHRILHFATHGVLNTRRPELSGIVLSLFDEEGRRKDGFLRLHDVYNMRLAADLVVLSGCQTALGKEMRGEGLIGLTRGFMYAGARAVVASLWQVDDESTAELMKRFYRGMLKENRRPADALRAAQLEMSRDKRWSAPFYWAGFVLQGEWR